MLSNIAALERKRQEDKHGNFAKKGQGFLRSEKTTGDLFKVRHRMGSRVLIGCSRMEWAIYAKRGAAPSAAPSYLARVSTGLAFGSALGWRSGQHWGGVRVSAAADLCYPSTG